MNYLSVCSGIEAATVAWHPLGWKATAYSEIEAFPSAVLAHHYPQTPNWGDMTKFKEWPDAAVDVLVGGTPCQSFSVAGLRKGMDDPRGNLALTYLAIADRYRPRWLVWENVPGVLSSNGGRGFGAFLGGVGKLGYGFAYRVLDAQYFGLAQRRKRVFVIGCLGDWRAAAAVLFEPESLRGDSAPSRETGKAAPIIPSRSTAGGGLGTDFDCDGGLIARCVTAGEGQRLNYETETLITHSLRGEGFDASEDGTGRGTPLVPVAHTEVMPTMQNGADTPAGHNARSGHTKDNYIVPLAFAENSRHELRLEGGDGSRTGALSTGGGKPGQGAPMVAFTPVAFDWYASQSQSMPVGEFAPPLKTTMQPAVAFDLRGREGGAMPEGPHDTANIRAASGGSSRSYVAQPSAVRRLTPVECERLQGFPDGYSAIPYRNKQAADGPRYK
ncbi:MAG: DNA (cytosine-5-)-methyltransferase, partial [Ectothiorhodospiraceae bacterium]|nr:DNA (cytosine-5-)-methyltransferase [Ectothiorhodospiraceae bacterium]